MSKIYVASSWRNPYQQRTVKALRESGHDVYDFRNPPNHSGFAWSQVGLEVSGEDRNGEVVAVDFLPILNHPIVQAGFNSDFDAMKWATHVLMVLPCGKSAHLELGWATGAGKKTAIALDVQNTPELMYLCADKIIYTGLDVVNEELLEWAES